jgi:hypothetical protein
MKGKPGDEFEIQLGYKHIRLKAILVPRGYANEPTQ